MKWFKHESDAYTNLKLEQIMDEFGMAGYGFFWLCCELVGHQGGAEFLLKPEKNWKNALMRRSKFSEDRVTTILLRFSELELIDKKALKKGILFIPKMAERSDEYTAKLRRVSGHNRDNVGLEQNRLDKIRTDKTAGTNLNLKPGELGPGKKQFEKVGDVLKKKFGNS